MNACDMVVVGANFLPRGPVKPPPFADHIPDTVSEAGVLLATICDVKLLAAAMAMPTGPFS